jgi:hypothetical protein
MSIKHCPKCKRFTYQHDGHMMRFKCVNPNCDRVETELEREQDIAEFKRKRMQEEQDIVTPPRKKIAFE